MLLYSINDLSVHSRQNGEKCCFFSEMAIYLLCDSKIVMEEQKKKKPQPSWEPMGTN